MVIKVEDLQYRYSKQKELSLMNLNFSVEKGEIFGFLGPSGAGKSTTQKILVGLLKDYQGDIQVFNKSLKRWGNDYYNRIGVGFELPNHYEKFTALENLQLFSGFYECPRINFEQLFERVNLKDDMKKVVSKYSKGMKMRLNFIRAIMHNPDIIFLDEPTSGMDPVNAKIVKDYIRELKNNGKTVFLTTHNMHDAEELCDHVAFIVKGKIRCLDSVKSLKEKYSSHYVVVDYEEGRAIKSENFSIEQIGENRRFLDILREKNIRKIYTEETSLEQIYIRVTGEKSYEKDV